MSKFIVTIGSPESEVSLETYPSVEKLVEADDAYKAHKKAFFDCEKGQEVLSITDTSKRVLYTLLGGFVK